MKTNTQFYKEDFDRIAALSMIYESVKDRIKMPLDMFQLVMNDWNVIPLKEKGLVIGGVLEKENEVHIGYGIKPTFSIKGHLRKTLRKVIDKYGFAVTSVMQENEKGINFCKRLGFVEIKREQGKIYFKCDRCNYV